MTKSYQQKVKNLYLTNVSIKFDEDKIIINKIITFKKYTKKKKCRNKYPSAKLHQY